MAGKTVELIRTARIKNERRKAGEKVQVDAKTPADLKAAGAVALDDEKSDGKEAK